jgi:hypothetical protein
LGHPQIENRTPFAFEPLFIADEDLRPVVVTVVKATYDFDLHGAVRLADEQIPVNLGGEPSTDAPISSYRYEPEIALYKPATDVVLLGHAQPPGGGATQVDVGLKVGPVQKVARVFGDRYWLMVSHEVRMSRTAELGRVPLTWENAFGGHDETRSTPECAVLEPRNPVGTGFGKPLTKNGDHLRLPNLENPRELIGGYGDVVAPWGFGFTSPNWQPRARLAGTYDERWNKTRKPLLPVDFDRRFFNAAAPGLVAPGYLRGDEEVVVLNAAPVPRVAFRLPGVPPPQCRIVLRDGQETTLSTDLDTVIVDTDDQQLIMLWRGYALNGGGPHDVTAIEIALPS